MRLDNEEKARAMSILRWILFARRPLTVRELTEAVLSEQSSTSSYPYSDLPDNWDEYYVNGVIRRLCRSLVDVRGNASKSSIEAHTVHLMHASVKEFLTKHVTASADGAISFAEACREHEVLARTCLSYLCYEEVLPHALPLANDLDDRLGRFPFIQYASRAWSAHIETSGKISDSVGALIRKLLDPTASRWAAWSKVILSGATSSMKAELSHQSIPVSPLFWASYLGLREIVLWLLSRDVDVNASDEIYGSAIHAAASRGNTETLQLLIANGADANIPCTKYVYAVIRAVDKCPPKKIKEVISLLLEAGADITSCDRDGRTALHYATLSGSIETVAFLIQHGAAVDVSDKDGSTALVLAVEHGHTELVKLLVAKGANTETVNSKRQTPLLLAAGKNYLEILNFLLQNGARVNSKTGDEAFTPLQLAAAKGHIDALQALVLHGALVNMRSAGQPPLSPLSAAAYFGHCPIIQFLIRHGASVTDFDSEESSPLMFAVMGKCYPAVQCLLEEGAPVGTTIHGGYTPLHIAACAGRTDIIELFLQHGAQVNAAATRGATPLQVACDFGNALAVSCLIEHNADFELSQNGNTPSPLVAAIRQGSKEIVQLLLQLGANPDTIDPEQISPLAAAVGWGYSEIVQLLLEHGARPNAETEGNSMLILIAIKLGHTDVIRVLLWNAPDLDLDPSMSLACAIKLNRLDIVRLLIGLEPYKGLARDPVYVMVAASLECDGITQLLIHHSMEVDMID
jgi:ankyrin repeat protein